MKVYKEKEGKYWIGNLSTGVGNFVFTFNDAKTKVQAISSGGSFRPLPITLITELEKGDGTKYTGFADFETEMEGLL